MSNGSFDIIDVHMHCFTDKSYGDALVPCVEKLRRAGVSSIIVAGLVNTRLDARTMWNLIPHDVDNRGDALFNEADNLLELTRRADPLIKPLVDTRHLWWQGVPAALQNYIRRGFKGIKGIYLPDEANDLGVSSVPATFGITLEQYRRREWEILSFAHDNDLPLLYHMDARRYGDVMTAMLDDFPGLRVNFAHLGISRKAFRKVLDRYPNVFTDIASLLPHIKANPGSYRDFIMHFPDQVCFASDAFLYQTDMVLDYIQLVRDLSLPPDIEAQVFSGNAARFLGSALQQ